MVKACHARASLATRFGNRPSPAKEGAFFLRSPQLGNRMQINATKSLSKHVPTPLPITYPTSGRTDVPEEWSGSRPRSGWSFSMDEEEVYSWLYSLKTANKDRWTRICTPSSPSALSMQRIGDRLTLTLPAATGFLSRPVKAILLALGIVLPGLIVAAWESVQAAMPIWLVCTAMACKVGRRFMQNLYDVLVVERKGWQIHTAVQPSLDDPAFLNLNSAQSTQTGRTLLPVGEVLSARPTKVKNAPAIAFVANLTYKIPSTSGLEIKRQHWLATTINNHVSTIAGDHTRKQMTHRYKQLY